MITEAAPNQLSKRWDGASQIPQMLDHQDRKSTRLNSSHLVISYAVFCLQKKTVYLMRSSEINAPMISPRQLSDIWSHENRAAAHIQQSGTKTPPKRTRLE